MLDASLYTNQIESAIAFKAKYECSNKATDEIFESGWKIKIDNHYAEQSTLGRCNISNSPIVSDGLFIVFEFSGPELSATQYGTVSGDIVPTPLEYKGFGNAAIPFTNSIFQEYSFSHSLITDITALQKQHKVDDALDLLYQVIDDKLLNSEFGTIDFFLRQINVSYFSVDIVIGILTITLPWENSLLNRKHFFEKVKNRLSIGRSAEKVHKILEGLDA